MATHLDPQTLNIEEQLVRIRKMGAETEQALADIQKTRAETKVLTWATIFQAMLATAALIGAGAAIAKLFFP